MEDIKQKFSAVKDDGVNETPQVGTIPKSEAKELNKHTKTSTSSATDQELDVFLLGGDSDEGPGMTTVSRLNVNLETLIDCRTSTSTLFSFHKFSGL